MAYKPDPKPRARIKDLEAGKEKALREGRCRICRESRQLTRHHIVKRSQGGDDLDENLVPLCMGPGTKDCHGKVERRDMKARSALRATFTEIEMEYLMWKRNPAWLEREYPEPEEEAA